MLRDPGPIPPLDASWYPTTYEQPDFTDLVANALWEVDQAFLSMDSLLDPTGPLDYVLTGDTILADLDTVDNINGSNAHLAVLDPITNIDSMKADGDAAMTAAIQEIPGEAFSPVPAATQWGTVAGTIPTANIVSVTVTDLTNPGHSAFLVGDQFKITVQMDMTTGNTDDHFQVHTFGVATKDGVPQTNFETGDTDHTGSASFTGFWQATDVGNWSMVAHALPVTGGEVTSSPVTWAVATQNTGPPGPTVAAVHVTLINWTSGNLANNHSGDTWQLFVSGPANSEVTLWPTQNGTALSETVLGQTDSFGNYTLAGKWADTEIGTWTEHYAVGHFQMIGNLNFTVQPAGST